MRLIIFGAQGMARMTCEAIEGLNPDIRVDCFAVSRMKGNAEKIFGHPVRLLSELSAELSAKERSEIKVLIAIPESLQPEIEELLGQYGFPDFISINNDIYGELVGLYMVRLGRFRPIAALPIGKRRPFVRVFMVRSHMDVPLLVESSFPEYMLSIQVGAALTDRNIARLKDNRGENISEKNGNYCELTGLYWIWKNRLCAGEADISESGQYYGLAHYRRWLDLSDDDLCRLNDNDVDVVLPYPLPYEPDINAHHRKFLKAEDWDAVLRALDEIAPEYAEAMPKIFGQRYLFNCNILLAKRQVLARYCEWLFPILERVEELSTPKGNSRSDRYIGYVAESLETLYFMKNRDSLRIVYTNCRELG